MPKLINDRSKIGIRRELRKRMTRGETLLWKRLREIELPAKIRRQVSFGNFIVDFYCPRAKLIIEIDGDSHFQPGVPSYDRFREQFLRDQGFDVIRFTDRDICDTLDAAVLKLLSVIESGLKKNSPPLRGGAGGGVEPTG